MIISMDTPAPGSEAAPPPVLPFAAPKKEKPRRFPITRFRDIAPVLDGMWIIKGLLPACGVTAIYGASQSGKSFLLTDACLHIAVGQAWCGRKTQQTRVLMIAAEGQLGYLNRVTAARTKMELPDETPFDLITKAPNFGTSKEDALTLIREIKEEYGDNPPGLLGIDTLSQTMGGGDENSPQGMGMFLTNCKLIAEALNCTIIITHHVGKDIEKGERGHSSLPANIDCRWLVERLKDCSRVTVKKQRDGQDSLNWQFRLNRETLGYDEDNYEVTSCTVEITQAPEPLKTQPDAATTANQIASRGAREFNAAFTEALADHGEWYFAGGANGSRVKALRVPTIRPYFKRRWATGHDDTQKQAQAANTAFRRLIAAPPPAYYRATDGDVEWIWRLPQ